MNPNPKTDVRKRYTNSSSNLKQFRFYQKFYENTVSKELFNKVWIDFIYGDKHHDIKGIVNRMIFDNFEFRFPFRMGFLSIRKKKIRIKLNEEGKLSRANLRVDWKASKEIGQKVYHLNTHTMGYRMIWFWNKTDANFKNVRYCTFNIVRTLDRYLGSALQDPQYHLDYYLVPEKSHK